MNEELFNNEYLKYIATIDFLPKNSASKVLTDIDSSSSGGTSIGQQGTSSAPYKAGNYYYASTDNTFSRNQFSTAKSKNLNVIEKEAFFKVNDALMKKDIIGWEVICVKELDFKTSNFRQCFTTIPEAWVSKFDLYVEVINQELCVYVSPDYDRYIAGDEELIEAIERVLKSSAYFGREDFTELLTKIAGIGSTGGMDNDCWRRSPMGSNPWSSVLYDIDTSLLVNNSGNTITTSVNG